MKGVAGGVSPSISPHAHPTYPACPNATGIVPQYATTMVGLPEALREVTHYSRTGFRDLCVRSALSVRRNLTHYSQVHTRSVPAAFAPVE